MIEIMEPQLLLGEKAGLRKGILIKLGKAQAIIELGQEDGLDDDAILKRLQEKIIGLPLNRAESYLEEYRKKSI